MKIGIVYDVIYPFGLGGGEKRNWETAKRLAARGHEVDLISVQMWDGDREFVRDRVRCVGVCRWTPALSSGGKRSFWEPLHFARHLFSHLRRGDYDVIDCSNFPYLSCLAARVAIMFTRTRLVITWYEVRGLRRWIDHRGWLVGPIAWVCELIISRLTRHNVAISQFTAERAQRILGMRDAVVVPCGVDYEACSGRSGVTKEDQILYVGRLVKYKRVDMLIDAFADLAGAFPKHKLKIVGKGYERERLGALVRRMALEDRVVFVESLDEGELMREYARSRVFVLPSEQEGFGIVLLEAMAAGTPVVARDAPDSAAASLITDGKDGLLADNRAKLADAISLLLRDDALARKIAAAGAQTARAYDWDEIVLKLLRYYERIAGRECPGVKRGAESQ